MKAPIWLRQLGVPGVLGAALLLASAWVILSWLPRQHAAVQQTESDTRRLRHELLQRAERAQAEARAAQAVDAQAHAVADASAPSHALWASLWRDLPDASRRVDLQRAVLVSARDAGIPLASVQWRGEPVAWVDAAQSGAPPQGLWRQRLVLPVQASYPAVRTWVSALLREPALSLDSLDIQRSDPLSDQVKAQVSVSLWWRQDRRP
ncbi:MAG: hypothetical protein I8H88_03995 [Burkholderiales bacterium]|nr:hypothetical protein [Burkholderiales bacterium]